MGTKDREQGTASKKTWCLVFGTKGLGLGNIGQETKDCEITRYNW